MLSESIAKLVQYVVETELIPECERNYTTNLLLMGLWRMITLHRNRNFRTCRRFYFKP